MSSNSVSKIAHSVSGMFKTDSKYHHITLSSPSTETNPSTSDVPALTPTRNSFTLYPWGSDTDFLGRSQSGPKKKWLNPEYYLHVVPTSPSWQEDGSDFRMRNTECQVFLLPQNANRPEFDKMSTAAAQDVHSFKATVSSTFGPCHSPCGTNRSFLDHPTEPTVANVHCKFTFTNIRDTTKGCPELGLDRGYNGTGGWLLYVPKGCVTYDGGEGVVGAHGVGTEGEEEKIQYYKRVSK